MLFDNSTSFVFFANIILRNSRMYSVIIIMLGIGKTLLMIVHFCKWLLMYVLIPNNLMVLVLVHPYPLRIR